MPPTCQKIRCASLDKMPIDIFTHLIVPQLNKMTGSPEIVNEADIPIIMRSVTHLSLTCKKVYHRVNSQPFMQKFLEVLAKKYQKSQAYMAARLDNPGAREWLWNYTQKNGYKETYDTVQDIYALTGTILKEASSAGLEFKAEEERKNLPSPNPYYDQTQSGCFLLVNLTITKLATPFGQIPLYTSIFGRHFLPITEMFIRRLDAVFAGLGSSTSDLLPQDANRLIPVSSSKDKCFSRISYDSGKKITEKELEAQKGKQVLIVNEYGSDAIYAIQQVAGRTLVSGTWPASKREYEVGDAVWKMLQRPEMRRELLTKRKKGISVDLPAKSHLLDISNHAIGLVTQLAKQPLTKGRASNNSKLLPVWNYDEALEVELLNAAAQQFLKKESYWHIQAYKQGRDRIVLNNENLGGALGLSLCKNNKPCDLQTLKTAYDAVLNSIGRGWERAKLKDFPSVLHTKSEEDCFLFTKQQSAFPQEYGLITAIIQDLGISKYVHCYPDGEDESERLYLWIKKNKFKQISDSLQLKFHP